MIHVTEAELPAVERWQKSEGVGNGAVRSVRGLVETAANVPGRVSMSWFLGQPLRNVAVSKFDCPGCPLN